MHIVIALNSILSVALLLAGCSAVKPESPEPGRVVETRTSLEPEPRGESLLQRTMMSAHDDARREIGAVSLTWDSRLASDAQAYANKLARSGRFEHDPQSGVNERQGENLWTGTKNAYGYAEMAGGWVDEKRFFKRGLFPDNSNTGNWGDVGHYTQIICCLLYTSPSPRDKRQSRMPSSA